MKRRSRSAITTRSSIELWLTQQIPIVEKLIEISEIRGPLMAKSATETPGANLWHFQIKDQQGDRNGKDAIAKCFQAVRFHLLSLAQRCPHIAGPFLSRYLRPAFASAVTRES